ncbi:MAG: FtsQ-type POTRA domain-containing protein [Chloroflexi bacterium]|nr:FtsQ-type POTRA domain-containing protein [Chloroflexota bacterium]
MRSKKRTLQGEVLLNDQQEQRLRRFRWGRLLFAVAVVSLFAGSIGLYFSPLLRVQNVEVTGANVISVQDVLDLVDLESDSMLRVDTGEIVESVSALPMVLRVSVERDWPQTIRILITERSPWGFWKSGDNLHVIDSKGFVLSGVLPGEGALTIEAVDAVSQLSPGDRVDGDAVFLTQVLLQEVPKTVSADVTAIEFSAELGLSIDTDAGYRVVIGDSQNFNYKLAVWKALEGQLGPEGMAGQVLDLRFGDRPSLQPLATGGDET